MHRVGVSYQAPLQSRLEERIVDVGRDMDEEHPPVVGKTGMHVGEELLPLPDVVDALLDQDLVVGATFPGELERGVDIGSILAPSGTAARRSFSPKSR